MNREDLLLIIIEQNADRTLLIEVSILSENAISSPLKRETY
jgi:hypothetical protein